jgi:pseudaminic acid synthase
VEFPETIKIGKKVIGKDKPVYIIADIGANFDGNLKKAKELVLAAKKAGADCAKFQSFKSAYIVSGKGFSAMSLKGVHGSWNKPVDEVFKAAEFPTKWHIKLRDYCKKIGIDFSSSPYDREAIDLLVKLRTPFIKIGSGEITWFDQLEYIAKKKLPMFMSTGDSTLAEVDEAVSLIESTGNNKLVLMQCITNYPSKIESANLNVLKTYSNVYGVITGYSDHTPGDVVVLGAVALGAKVIEKHFTLNKKDKGPDHPHSMDVNEFYTMVQRIRDLEKALGSTRKFIVEEESETVIVQRRGLYANRDIKINEKITEKDVIELRPALGILPKYKKTIIGAQVKNDIDKNTPIYWKDLL